MKSPVLQRDAKSWPFRAVLFSGSQPWLGDCSEERPRLTDDPLISCISRAQSPCSHLRQLIAFVTSPTGQNQFLCCGALFKHSHCVSQIDCADVDEL